MIFFHLVADNDDFLSLFVVSHRLCSGNSLSVEVLSRNDGMYPIGRRDAEEMHFSVADIKKNADQVNEESKRRRIFFLPHESFAVKNVLCFLNFL